MTLTRHAYAIAGLATILTAISFSSSHFHTVAAVVPGSAPVTVMNTTSNPVPTVAQGTTTVDGTVHLAGDAAVSVNNSTSSPVPVAVQGTPTVNVGTLPAVNFDSDASVKVSNGSDEPIPVRGVVTGSSHVTKWDLEFLLAGQTAFQKDLYDVPAGKTLVMTDVYATMVVPAGQNVPIATIQGFSGGYVFEFNMPVRAQGADSEGNDFFTASMNGCGLVFDPGSYVDFSMARSSSTANATFQIGFTGYLTDAS